MSWELTVEEMRGIQRYARKIAAREAARIGRYDASYFLDKCWDSIALALQSYTPEKGVPLASWICVKMRFALLEERGKRYPISLDADAPTFLQDENHGPGEGLSGLLSYSPDMDAKILWWEVLAQLSSQQQELMCLLAQGFETPECARKLGIKNDTAYKRVQAVKDKVKRIPR